MFFCLPNDCRFLILLCRSPNEMRTVDDAKGPSGDERMIPRFYLFSFPLVLVSLFEFFNHIDLVSRMLNGSWA